MFIYKTICTVNDKIYIGKYQGIKKGYLGSGIILKKAIKKYGKDNFVREIIEDNINDTKLLKEREKFWIRFHDAQNPKIGYNLTSGGDGNDSIRTEEYKKFLSKRTTGKGNTFYGKRHSEETKEKLRIASTNGGPGDSTGIKRSEETKEKMSKSKMGDKNPSWKGGITINSKFCRCGNEICYKSYRCKSCANRERTIKK